MALRAIFLCFLSVLAMRAGERPGDWTGQYSPCDRHAAVLQHGPMSLGVRFSTSNRLTAAQFGRALDYWAGILEMDWHVANGRDCAIQIVDGQPGLFQPAEAARAQFPTAPSFQGWIAFNPRISMAANESFLVAVHELGHVLGLQHSTNTSSVMYYLCFNRPPMLDAADLAALAARHTLRRRAGLCPPLRMLDLC